MKYLKAEKASRKDLEMYVAVLSTQKNVYEEEADKLKKDLDDGEHAQWMSMWIICGFLSLDLKYCN